MSLRLPARAAVRAAPLLLVAPLVAARAQTPTAAGPVPEFARQVEVRRTAHGVPHIRAPHLKGAAYGLAWVQLEDHGAGVALGLLRARGEMGRWFGRDSMAGDFLAQRARAVAVERYAQLDQATRDVYEGFAEGVNRYVALHPQEFPAGFAPRFTGYDVATRDVNLASANQARRFLARVAPAEARAGGRNAATAANDPSEEGEPTPGVDRIEEGSNAWAFAPSRTKSGRAILVRNPHLAWTAGYYEAHVSVPAVLDFYGDFRIGGPFGVIGGFNKDLGWSTTNNAPDLDEIYALDVDPAKPDHYLLDGASLPLQRELVTVAFKNGDGVSTETREFWRTPLGPVIHRDGGKIHILRAAAEGEWRAGEQFLQMMRASSLAEWKQAMRTRARINSSFTYADRAGNILYVWNASIPSLPHPSGGDTASVPAHRTSDVWTRYVPFDSLPQLLNPPGGYVRNENDAPYHTNLHRILDRSKYPANFPEPSLRLRSQLSLALVDTKQKLSLEDAIALKHSYRMLLADRVKADLLAAVRAASPDAATAQAADVLARWDNTAGPTSRGAVLFETWWRRYTEGQNADSMFAKAWTVAEPATTPRGLKDPARAAQAFTWAVTETARRHGDAAVAWGDVHRVRMGRTDVPVGGCGGALGCFRVLNFRTDPDGKRSVIGGDGWVLAVEFGREIPRAFSVLAYGQSARPESPLYGDQAAMFARGEMKRVAFTPADVDAQTVRRYVPGAEP
ncbi:penicillin acylase family protein [Roseisolibacter agri]|uniref:7-beta-(4-carbaxybutanamido)cephalosporanic acid acylase n=1 Tax=Roseisolibacter agri TaxID=2014610 RepID=A0AA37Q6G5_9BACT|nr:penicillin acylase family protein [Roseisolibacter agri]GLC23881.1 7-beta-(4-carbaxybutanamido)cephalosporanic acid acylase [Roseisolibacter agri]